MTVAELIEKLRAIPGEMGVIVATESDFGVHIVVTHEEFPPDSLDTNYCLIRGSFDEPKEGNK